MSKDHEHRTFSPAERMRLLIQETAERGATFEQTVETVLQLVGEVYGHDLHVELVQSERDDHDLRTLPCDLTRH